MNWELEVAGPAKRELKKAPPEDRRRILGVLEEMARDPFSGDIVRLHGLPAAWRRRVGQWRILFDILPPQRRVVVQDIRRRSSTTYRHR